MPIYDYRCPECGEQLEELVRDSTDTVKCPNCDTTMVRLVSAPANFDLVGEGFYNRSR